MRLIAAFLFILSILSCNNKNSVLSEKEFAKIYLDSLSKKYPTVKFNLNSDLTITSKKGDQEFQHYIVNAYTAYKADPSSIKDVISRYLAATRDLYVETKGLSLSTIVPVIKPIEYLDQINSLNPGGKSVEMITEKYNDQLIIAYAEDSKNSIKYLTEDNFKTLSIPRDSLKSVALRNLDKIAPNIQRQGENGLYMITAGGDYEASLILLSSLWTKENFPVDGDFIIAIPNRDLLMVTGSKNKIGISKIREIVAKSYATGNYQVSENLYIWRGKRFEKYD